MIDDDVYAANEIILVSREYVDEGEVYIVVVVVVVVVDDVMKIRSQTYERLVDNDVCRCLDDQLA
jgi:hypothetical protein